MKKIFFLLSAMNVGGVEKAFLNMLPYIPRDKYEIHMGLLSYKGGFLEDIPSDVHVHHIDCYCPFKKEINDPALKIIKELIKNRAIGKAIIHFFLYLHFKLTNNRYWFYQYILKDTPQFPIKFDLAVAYAGPSQAVDYYVSKKIQADKKCGWIHFDVNKFGIDEGMTRQLYKNYSKIFLVSKTAKVNFDDRFPSLANKTDVFYNIVSPELVMRLADKAPTFTDSFDGKRILTVGRMTQEKGHDFAVKALKIVLDRGYNVKWYFVGDGNYRLHCEELARQLGIEDKLVFLGTEKNPYGYMKDCDIYMQPSRHEGYCITLAEARIFTNPIVSTDFVGAREQLANRPNGCVTGFSESEMADGIIQALSFTEYNHNEKLEFHTDMDKFFKLLA